MSECVVRMEMPQGCWCCPFGHYDWIWGDDEREKMVCFCCLDLESEEDGHYLLETELKRPSWCPIICQLPEGHGRLVDAELVKEILKPVDSISHYEPEWTWGELHESNCVAIDNAPTIVPAERREE